MTDRVLDNFSVVDYSDGSQVGGGIMGTSMGARMDGGAMDEEALRLDERPMPEEELRQVRYAKLIQVAGIHSSQQRHCKSAEIHSIYNHHQEEWA